ncbi:hypothetical protein [Sphingobacterium hungaricum]|uniref:DUF2116 family Zn-ribbon domain-containing protein n=1 Tax=Sphingobacterium hungaricum TaxID=2082723 RepID=A0A928YSB1_9SPHI|nr:hypothetical protein [Sphingobacterium hungaricum]MBE8715542.1 hypothetical protein [Sphingobacterium hungaricum]
MERFCLDCGTLLKGRIDKKFCDDQCRSHYNNHVKADDSLVIRSINQILKKNRSILKSLNPDGKNKVKRKSLMQKGFDFTYFTHTYSTQKGSLYYFCYEYGYLNLENEEVLLVRRGEK